MANNVAFLGLGVMGYPMAGHLAAKGLAVTVFNRNREKSEKWLKEFGKTGEGNHKSAETPAAAAKDQDIVFACVGADPDVRAITLGLEGAFTTMKKASVFVDHTTASAELARELSVEAEKRGFGFLDAPVSGGEVGAVNGTLTVMIGGKEADYKKCQSAIGAYAKMQKLLGKAGSGQTAKMVNQICIAGIVQGLAEGLHFGLEAGLDMEAVIEVISKGAAGSWQMENRASTMIASEFNFGFAVDWMRKDLGMVFSEARRMGLNLPMAEMADGFYKEIQGMGGSRQDTSSLIRRFRG
ncbi:MAG: NAD(P)-dependent oxidoreductase [Sphingomonadales bacterium]